ncbi:MAG: hypothetical protein WBY44_18155 [Bryobacteraceae bacterium]
MPTVTTTGCAPEGVPAEIGDGAGIVTIFGSRLAPQSSSESPAINDWFSPQISQAYWQKAVLHGITEFPHNS